MAQHDRYRDPEFRVFISRVIVASKLKNQRSLLVRYQRNRPDADLQGSMASLKESIRRTGEVDSVEGLMGVEGAGSKVYFEAYGRLVSGGFEFSRREYHPAPDPVNALLSFGYMILFNELNSLLEGCGFDVFLGFLHSTRYGRASLATDMIEELRSPVIDRLVLYLINKGAITPGQFTEVEGKKGVRMDEEAMKSFLANYEKFMATPFQDPVAGKHKNFREILREKVVSLERSVLNRSEYAPFLYHS